MSQSGGRFCADVNGTFSGDYCEPEPKKAPDHSRATMLELAAAHDGQPPATWYRFLIGMFREAA